MKGNNPGRRNHISLHNSQPAEVQINPEDDLWCFTPPRSPAHCKPVEVQINPEDDMWCFTPPRIREDTPPTHAPSQMQNDYEADDSDFTPRSPAPRRHPQVASKFPQRLPSSSSVSLEESSQQQCRQQPSKGLGQANILNKVDALERRAKVLLYTYSRWLR